MKLELTSERNFASAYHKAKTLHKKTDFKKSYVKRTIINRFLVQVFEKKIQLIDLVNNFGVMHLKPNFKADVQFFLQAPNIGNSKWKEITYGGMDVPSVYDGGIYRGEYNYKIDLINMKDLVSKTITYLNTISLGGILNIQSVVRSLNYGDTNSELANFDKIFVSYFEDTYTTEPQNVLNVMLQLDLSPAGVVQSESLEGSFGFSPTILSTVDGTSLFSLLDNQIKRLFKLRMDEDYQRLYEYISSGGVYSWVDISADAMMLEPSTVDYYDDTETLTTEALSDYKLTSTNYQKFFSADKSLYVYRINCKINSLSPRVNGSPKVYAQSLAVPHYTSEVTVDKLLKTDLSSIIETYTLSGNGSNIDRRLNKRFPFSGIGTSFVGNTFGFGATNHVIISDDAANLSADSFKNPTSNLVEDIYNSYGVEGFWCVLPKDGAVLIKNGIEYPILLGQYHTVKLEGAHTILTNESCAVWAKDGSFEFIQSGLPVIQHSTDMTEAGTASFPPSNYDMFTSYALECLPPIRHVVSDGNRIYFTCRPHSNEGVSNQSGSSSLISEGTIEISSAVPFLRTATINRFLNTPLSSLVVQSGISGFLGTVYKAMIPQYTTNNTYNIKVYLITSIANGIPTAMYYMGRGRMHLDANDSGSMVVDPDYDVLDLEVGRWSSLSSSYSLLIDAGWPLDNITVAKGV